MAVSSRAPVFSGDNGAATAEEELRAFSYIVSHDLTASFRHVAEFSRLLLDEVGETLTERQASHASHIRAATAKCQLMMEQLLVFSRVQQGDLNLARQDASAALRLPLAQLALETTAPEAVIVVEPLGLVVADPELLTLALHHLIANALKFRRPAAPPRITIGPAHDDEAWRIRISDNGLGVAPAQREKAFRMFHQLHGEAAFPGVGAGLAICRRIARRHGGDVVFRDATEGACIELSLRRASPPGHELQGRG
jgi:light-regulated signal transduction histidine kinase (bacteriophytochrome)